jgi:type I restriction enzyme R subunit
MGAEAREAFAGFIPDGDMKAYADGLKENIRNNFTETMKLLRNKEFQELLENYPRPKKVFFKGYDIVDTVDDEVMFRVGDEYQRPQDYLRLFEEFVQKNPEQIEAIEILISRPSDWNADVLDDLRDKLRKNHFSEEDLQRGHELVYKKPLADIISMVKHASDYDVPILTARERVEKAVARIAENRAFTQDQKNWLAYIQDHLVKNLAISREDFEIMPVFERRGGLTQAKRIFGEALDAILREINESLAA